MRYSLLLLPLGFINFFASASADEDLKKLLSSDSFIMGLNYTDDTNPIVKQLTLKSSKIQHKFVEYDENELKFGKLTDPIKVEKLRTDLQDEIKKLKQLCSSTKNVLNELKKNYDEVTANGTIGLDEKATKEYSKNLEKFNKRLTALQHKLTQDQRVLHLLPAKSWSRTSKTLAFVGLVGAGVVGGYFAHRYGYDKQALDFAKTNLPVVQQAVKNGFLFSYEKCSNGLSSLWSWVKNFRSKPANPVDTVVNNEDLFLNLNPLLTNVNGSAVVTPCNGVCTPVNQTAEVVNSTAVLNTTVIPTDVNTTVVNG